MINLDFEEDGDLFRLSEKGEAELIASSLRDKIDSYLREGWQGGFGIKDCRNEEEVIEVLEGIENDPETSDEHSAEAFRAYVM